MGQLLILIGNFQEKLFSIEQYSINTTQLIGAGQDDTDEEVDIGIELWWMIIGYGGVLSDLLSLCVATLK